MTRQVKAFASSLRRLNLRQGTHKVGDHRLPQAILLSSHTCFFCMQPIPPKMLNKKTPQGLNRLLPSGSVGQPSFPECWACATWWRPRSDTVYAPTVWGGGAGGLT